MKSNQSEKKIEVHIFYEGYPIILDVYSTNTFHNIIEVLQNQGYFPNLQKEKVRIVNLNEKCKNQLILSRQNIFQLHKQSCLPFEPFIASINWSTKQYHITLSYQPTSFEVTESFGNRTYISHLIRYFKVLANLDSSTQLRAVINGKLIQKQTVPLQQVLEKNVKKIQIMMLNVDNAPLYKIDKPRYSSQKQVLQEEKSSIDKEVFQNSEIIQRYRQSSLQLEDFKFDESQLDSKPSSKISVNDIVQRYNQSKLLFDNLESDKSHDFQNPIQRYNQSKLFFDNFESRESCDFQNPIKRYEESGILFSQISQNIDTETQNKDLQNFDSLQQQKKQKQFKTLADSDISSPSLLKLSINPSVQSSKIISPLIKKKIPKKKDDTCQTF